jgi:hypothetical protein
MALAPSAPARHDGHTSKAPAAPSIGSIDPHQSKMGAPLGLCFAIDGADPASRPGRTCRAQRRDVPGRPVLKCVDRIGVTNKRGG